MTTRIRNDQLVTQQIGNVLLQHQHSAEDQTCCLWRVWTRHKYLQENTQINLLIGIKWKQAFQCQ